MSDGQLLFRIVRRSDGHEYKIFADGRVEGFERDVSVFNRHPMLVRVALQNSDRNGMSSRLPLKTKALTEDWAGAEHGTPLNAEISDIAIAIAPE